MKNGASFFIIQLDLTKQALLGKAAIGATIDVGAFPRELTLEASGHILLLTNYYSNTLSIIDVAKLPD